MNNRKMKPIVAAIGTAFAVSLTAGAIGCDGSMSSNSGQAEGGEASGNGAMSSSSDQAKGGEASCGEGNCGGAMSSSSDQAEGDEANEDARADSAN